MLLELGALALKGAVDVIEDRKLAESTGKAIVQGLTDFAKEVGEAASNFTEVAREAVDLGKKSLEKAQRKGLNRFVEADPEIVRKAECLAGLEEIVGSRCEVSSKKAMEVFANMNPEEVNKNPARSVALLTLLHMGDLNPIKQGA